MQTQNRIILMILILICFAVIFGVFFYWYWQTASGQCYSLHNSTDWGNCKVKW